MALPSNLENLQAVAEGLKNTLDRLGRNFATAKASLLTDRQYLSTCYARCRLFLDMAASLSAAGITPEILGPYMGALYGVDWTLYAADYDTLKTVEIPALIAVIEQYGTEIIAGSVLSVPPYGHVLAGTLSAQAQADITAALDACIARFG